MNFLRASYQKEAENFHWVDEKSTQSPLFLQETKFCKMFTEIWRLLSRLLIKISRKKSPSALIRNPSLDLKLLFRAQKNTKHPAKFEKAFKAASARRGQVQTLTRLDFSHFFTTRAKTTNSQAFQIFRKTLHFRRCFLYFSQFFSIHSSFFSF